jgi:hypothetical protein
LTREFFVYKPNFLRHIFAPDSKPRGFQGELPNVQQGANIDSVAAGAQVALVKRVQ